MRILKTLPKDEYEKAQGCLTEYLGGLGDVIIRCHQAAWYSKISALPPDQESYIAVISHNPHSKELFQWHPTSDRLTIIETGFHYPWDDPSWRESVGLPSSIPFECREQAPISYYPSPEDAGYLQEALSLGRYVVLALSAGDRERNIPTELLSTILRVLSQRRVPVVRIGRSYMHLYADGVTRNQVVEEQLLRFEGLNLVDRLSVPGTASLIMHSAGLLCTHSAMCHVAQYGHKPYFLLYTPWVKDNYVSRGPVGYMFRCDQPDNDHMTFSEFTGDRLERWLERIR